LEQSKQNLQDAAVVLNLDCSKNDVNETSKIEVQNLGSTDQFRLTVKKGLRVMSEYKSMIENLRNRLLDTTNRNKMISFKHSEKQKTIIRIVDLSLSKIVNLLQSGSPFRFQPLPELAEEFPDEQNEEFKIYLSVEQNNSKAWNKLLENEEDLDSIEAQKVDRELRNKVRETLGLPKVQSGKRILLADWAKLNSINPSYNLPLEDEDEKLAEGLKCLFLPEDLELRLSRIYDQNRTSQQESGVGILYLAIGFLEWFESESSDVAILSPLLLYELDLEKGKGIGGNLKYNLSCSSEIPTINLSLRERLKKDFKLALPDFREDDTVVSYLAAVNEIITEKRRWSLKNFATVGLFSFSRLVMYNDLDPKNWGSEDGLSDQGVLKSIFHTKEGVEASAEDYDLDDKEIISEVPVFVLDADSTQHMALIDALRGKNLVIKGPPGTGKSQTITNLIAAALCLGKKVLFVAEKATALDVVKKRLDAVGIGEFCFELHSTKARKADVIASLEKRLKFITTFSGSDHHNAESEAERLKDELTSYANIMGSPYGAVEIFDSTKKAWRPATVYDLLWSEIRSREYQIDHELIQNITFTAVDRFTRFDLAKKRDLLSIIEAETTEFEDRYGVVESHPWNFVSNENLIFTEYEKLFSIILQLIFKLGSIDEIILNGYQYIDINLEIETLESLSIFLKDHKLPVFSNADIDINVLNSCLRDIDKHNNVRNTLPILRELSLLRHQLEAFATDVNGRLDAQLIRECGSIARDWSLIHMTVVEVKSQKIELENQINNATKLIKNTQKIYSDIGISVDKIDGEKISFLRKIKEVLTAFDPEAISYIDIAKNRDANQTILNRIKDNIDNLIDLENAIDEDIGDFENIDLIKLEADVEYLKNAGLITKFSKKYKTTTSFVQSVLRNKTKLDDIILSKFTALFKFKRALDQFESTNIFRNLLGNFYEGIETPIHLILKAFTFSSLVKQALPKMDEPSRSLRNFLLDGNIDSINYLKSVLANPDFLEIISYYESFKFSDNTAIDTIKDQERTDALKRLLNIASTIGIRDEVKFGDYREAITLQEAYFNLIAQDTFKQFSENYPQFVDPISAYLVTEKTLNTLESINFDDIGHNCENKFLLFPSEINVFFEGLSKFKQDINSVSARLLDELSIMSNFTGKTGMELKKVPISNLKTLLARSLSNKSELNSWIKWLKAKAQIFDAGLDELAFSKTSNGLYLKELVKSFDRIFNLTMIRGVTARYPQLASAQIKTQTQIQREFALLDDKINEIKKGLMISELLKTPIPAGRNSIKKSELTQLALIHHQINLQTRHMPIRDLMARADEAILSLKPCHMMSPSSVSQFLKPKQIYDLIIIDEASQMRPEEALGALARAGQAIIVGDNKQLPPPREFMRSDDEDEIESDDHLIEESILDIARGAFRPERELLWHYRSRHGSLIAFSNRHFYNDRLVIFPSPSEEQTNFGLKYFNVAGVYNGSVNVLEAKAVCAAVIEHMTRFPEKSLGVVALNEPQREMIRFEIDRMISRNRAAQKYREIWDNTLEYFFVKNLETVQGDERDIIIISTVYGPDPAGNIYQRFRRINDKAGDRRLNVLFSRSKYGTYVYSSLLPEQIKVESVSTPPGTRLLREYLEYASTKRLHSGQIPYADCDSDFELAVKERLEAQGFQVFSQVGVAGYRIDLGVKHPEWKFGFLFGIECDGATYHSSRSARDRDKFRQKHLENLGWDIYRIWSTDWFKNQNNEVDKLIKFALDLLVSKLAHINEFQPIEGIPLKNIDADNDDLSESLPAKGSIINSVGNNKIEDHDAKFRAIKSNLDKSLFYKDSYKSIIEELIDFYVMFEGPISLKMLSRNIASDHGFDRTGPKIVDIVKAVVGKKYYSTPEADTVFYWPRGTDEKTWAKFRAPSRFRYERSIDDISKFELMALARAVIEKGFRDEIALQKMKDMAKFRLTERMQNIFRNIYLEAMQETNQN